MLEAATGADSKQCSGASAAGEAGTYVGTTAACTYADVTQAETSYVEASKSLLSTD